jgi:hypothetical protein
MARGRQALNMPRVLPVVPEPLPLATGVAARTVGEAAAHTAPYQVFRWIGPSTRMQAIFHAGSPSRTRAVVLASQLPMRAVVMAGARVLFDNHQPIGSEDFR